MHSNVEKTYKKVSQIEHILLRSDTYIGSISEVQETKWVCQGEDFVHKKIKYVPGLYKIFDEILVNAADNYQRDKKMTKIQVKIGREEISVMNDGKGIPVQIHKTHKIYVPQLIFGHLLTSSNYQDTDKKVVGGRNGYGAKLANLFSNHFEIEVADSLNKKVYHKIWRKNMMESEEATIKVYEGTDYTKVTFRPDFARFQIAKFNNDMINFMKRRVYDISGILKIKVYLNGKMVQVPNFKQYSKMYLENPNEEMAEQRDKAGRWQVLACRSEGQFNQVSFVNSIATAKGGTHVNYILDQIVDKLIQALSKKKVIQIKPFQVKAHLNIFVNSLIQNPCFDSQIKENMTLQANRFGSTCVISDDFIKVLLKNGVGQVIMNAVKAKEHSKIQRELKKAKKNRLVIPKLEDANQAGRSKKCCLILTQGDSAKALALCGLQQLGRDYFGVFPLRGKPSNVKSMTPKMVMENAQLSSIVKIIGLSFGTDYKTVSGLRYGSVMIMADQDIDGSHIKGLVINFFQTFWPSLCKIDGFLKQFITPIIKCKKGTNSINFYSLVDFNLWKQGNNDQNWTIKYYKGLGTSTAKQAKEYFSQLSTHEISFSYKTIEDQNVLDLAFDKKNANMRKQWLGRFDPQSGLDHRINKLTIEDFVNKELIHYSNEDNIRSIPSLVDGLKPSQRKIIFACFKRNLNSEIKVAQLVGYVAQHSAYHHGEMSLSMAITSMAQTFVGSNNLNLLQPLGQFGTRYQKGKDSASARYIFTKLNPLTRYLFKEQDDHVVEYQYDDNQNIEPRYYLPILPLVLINGAEGIGTGWSTNVSPHKVLDVIQMMRDRIKGRERQINIGWQNFKGSVSKINGKFMVEGVFQVQDETVTIRQIPPYMGIRDYKAFLEDKLGSQDNDDPDLQDMKEYHHDNNIQFVIKFILEKQPHDQDMQKYLKLSSNHQLTNMHLFNPQRKIHKYQTIQQIVQEFYHQRIKGYQKRKKYLISKFKKESDIISNQVRFINEIIDGTFKMIQSKQEWVGKLRDKGYAKYQDLNRIYSTKNKEEDDNQKNSDFNYLLSMPIWSFCQEKIRDMTSVQEQLTTIMKHYQNVTEKELWIKDIDSFENAWMATQEGKEVKQQNNRRSQLVAETKQGKKKRVVVEEDMEEEVVTEKKKTRRGRSMMEEVVEKETVQKGVKKKEEPEVLQTLKPLKLQVPEKQQKSGIDALLSKYLIEDGTNQGGQLSLLNRIKSRITGGDQSYDASYKQAKRQLSEQKVKKMQEEYESQEDIKDYLL